MKIIEQKARESRAHYLGKARRACRARYNELLTQHRNAHPSHSVCEAMRDTQKKYTSLESFGVEYASDFQGSPRHKRNREITFLNMGDPYALTICYTNNRFRVTSVGDLIE